MSALRLDLAGGLLLRRMGTPGGPPVLALHGFGEDSASFAPLAGEDLGGIELIALDFPGAGASPAAGTGLAAHTEAALAVIEHIAPARPLGLLAHSAGGPVAVAVAARMPARITALVSLEGNVTAADAFLTRRTAQHDTAADFHAAFLAAVWRRAASDPAVHRYAASVFRTDPEALYRLGRDIHAAGDTPGEAYAALTIPTLYVWSKATTNDVTQAFLKDRGLSHRLVDVPSHTITVDAPALAAAIVREVFANGPR